MIHNVYQFSLRPQLSKNVIELIQHIEVEMLHFNLLPGSRLIEDYLMLKYDAKRHTVRSALTELERLGVVDKPPNAGAFIKRFTQKEVEDLYLIRDILSREAIFLIIHPVSEDNMQHIETQLKQYELAVEEKDIVMIHYTNMMFHHAIFALCNNKFIQDMLDYNYWLSFPIRAYSMSDEESRMIAQEDHRKMLLLLKNGDIEGLYALNLSHMQDAKNGYIERFLKNNRNIAPNF